MCPRCCSAPTWLDIIHAPAWIGPLGLITAAMCAVTVFCTAKIYSSLKTIRAWNHPLTVPVYLAFALASGGALLTAIATIFDRFQIFQVILTGAALLVLIALKFFYWRGIDSAERTHTMAAATGLGRRRAPMGSAAHLGKLHHEGNGFCRGPQARGEAAQCRIPAFVHHPAGACGLPSHTVVFTAGSTRQSCSPQFWSAGCSLPKPSMWYRCIMAQKKPSMLAEGVRWFDDWFAIENIAPGVHAIGEPRFHQINWNYLIEGSAPRLLFDTGPGVRDISEVVRIPDRTAGDRLAVASCTSITPAICTAFENIAIGRPASPEGLRNGRHVSMPPMISSCGLLRRHGVEAREDFAVAAHRHGALISAGANLKSSIRPAIHRIQFRFLTGRQRFCLRPIMFIPAPSTPKCRAPTSRTISRQPNHCCRRLIDPKHEFSVPMAAPDEQGQASRAHDGPSGYFGPQLKP